MRITVPEIEYHSFVQQAKYLEYLYDRYQQSDEKNESIEAIREEVEDLIRHNRFEEIAKQLKKKKFSSDFTLPQQDYLDFSKLIRYSFQLM